MYNIYDLDWDEELLEILEVPREVLPEVKPSSYVLARPIRAPSSTRPSRRGDSRRPAGGTLRAGLLRTGAGQEHLRHGLLRAHEYGHRGRPEQRRSANDHRLGLGDEPVEYALEGAIFVTGAAVQWLRDGLGIIEDAAETEELAKSIDSNDGVCTSCPRSSASGAALGLLRQGDHRRHYQGNTRAHLARAALGLWPTRRGRGRAMERDSGIELKDFRADGGARREHLPDAVPGGHPGGVGGGA